MRSLQRSKSLWLACGHTIHESVENCLSVLLHQVVDVAENATVTHVSKSSYSVLGLVVVASKLLTYHMMPCK